MSELLVRKEICLYNIYGYIYLVFNPFGKFWNIWLLDKEYELLYHGVCFHSDLWFCITALVTTEGRK